jgi:DNA-binding response OmpR family regulator
VLASDCVVRRVLLVDDEDSILAALRRLLRREPYETITARSAQEALRYMEDKPVDVIISDQRMPGTTGTELIHEIRKRWPSTLRIILSGYSEVSSIIAAINEGEIYKFISKPWNDEELKLHIRRAIEQSQLQADNRRMALEIMEQNRQLIELNQLLDQRAADASVGQTCTQDLIESVDVGVVAVDTDGLIVGANGRAHQFINVQGETIVGVPARTVLPPSLAEVVRGAAASCSGRLCLEGRHLQWRVRPMSDECSYRGLVISLWEEVA